jgi:hypothetical protein
VAASWPRRLGYDWRVRIFSRRTAQPRLGPKQTGRRAVSADGAPQQAPIPSGAHLKDRTAPPHGAADVITARVDLAKQERAARGVRALAERMDEIERLRDLGVPVRCVFDLDNTVVDTRYRTLWCAQEFDRRHGTSWFADLPVDRVLLNGRDTARGLGLPDDVVEAFGALWDYEFWNPANLVHDVQIDEVVAIIREAQHRGAEVSFLTGRAEQFVDRVTGETKGFLQATLDQLRKPPASLDVTPGQVVMKPSPEHKTAVFKEQMLRKWAERGEIGFFLTEGRADIAHARGLLPDLTCFLLQCTFEDGGPELPGVHELLGRW